MTILTLLSPILLSLCVTMGFGILFNIPRETLIPCGLVGMVGHLTRFSLQELGTS
jgi:uncharacterized membrane protein YjjB (DUF3815 family)